MAAKFKRGDVVRHIDNAANRKECPPETMKETYLVLIPFMRMKRDYGRVFVGRNDGVEFSYPPEVLEMVPADTIPIRWRNPHDNKIYAERQLRDCVDWCVEHNVAPPTKEKRFYTK